MSPRSPISPGSRALPVDGALPELLDALNRQRLVIFEAPAGTGKTTRVPPALIGQRWLSDQRILLLEPRRIAARAAATRMASERGEKVGQTIGIRTRNDTRSSAKTEIEVITEGVLTRMLLDDPSLTGIGAVIFDEFHERSLHADTGLAFTRETCGALRPDLRVLIMSATLDAEALAARLRADAIVRVSAEIHPVETRYRPITPGANAADEPAAAIVEVLADPSCTGDILVFLPGASAINRTDRKLQRQLAERLGRDLTITPLHGSLSAAEQDAALIPDPDGRRKIILSTPIAETSVTIDGVATVVDGGQRRQPELDPGRGLSGLRTTTASRGASDQRRGRAGRQGPGVCIRLWPEAENHLRPAAERPEITISDLTALALQVAAWGADTPTELPWLDPPPPVHFSVGQDTLRTLGALDERGRLTPHGAELLTIGAEPRLAHLMHRGRELEAAGASGALQTACQVAAVLSDRDLLTGRDRPADLRARLEALSRAKSPGGRINRMTRDLAAATALRWERQLSTAGEHAPANLDLVGLCISLAFPERIAQRRQDSGSFLLASGAGVTVSPNDGLARETWLAVAETAGVGGEARILTAAPLSLDDIETHHAAQLRDVEYGAWDRRANDVVFESRTQLGAIIVSRRPNPDPPREPVIEALLAGVARNGLSMLSWETADQRFRARMNFAHVNAAEDWPAVGDDALLDCLDQWLAPSLSNAKRRRDLEAVKPREALGNLLNWRQARELDATAPTHLDFPSGSRIPVDYGADGTPSISVRLQEVFGLTESPLVGSGVPVVLHLLSPAHRPVQVTTDLASFWTDAYVDVRRELRGRYPKHQWPEDPTAATPTRRAKGRS